MISKITNWVSRIFRLVLITRSTFEQLVKELNDVKEVLKSYEAALADFRAQNASLRIQVSANNSAQNALDAANAELKAAKESLTKIAQNTTLSNGTARKLTAIAAEGLAAMNAELGEVEVSK